MKRLLKSWAFWAFVVPPLALAAALFLGALRRLEICPDCASTRVVRYGYAGMGGSRVRITSERIDLTESHVLREFLPPDHGHRWVSRQTSAGNWLISTCGVGAASSANGFCESYEYSAEFREFVRKKLVSGNVERAELAEALLLPRYLNDVQQADVRIQRLRQLGEDLLVEFSKAGP